MLKIRILTALIIFPVTVAAVFLAPPWLFRLVIAVVLLMGCWEYRRLADLSPTAGLALVSAQFLVFALLSWFWPQAGGYALPALGAGCLTWLLMFSRLAFYQEGKKPDAAFRRLGFLCGLSALSFCFFSLAWLQEQANGPFVVFLLLLIIWASDVGAYFSGKRFGHRKLAPMISPKKTWEGVAGGVVLAGLAAYLWSYTIAGLEITPVQLAGLSVLTSLTSVCGDLFISLQKRTMGMKDTGTLFPGHGGVLDRYDSLVSGAPFFALAWLVFVT